MRVPVAVLLHELPDGSSHVDLLVAPTDAPIADDDRAVQTWRATKRPDCLEVGAAIELEEIGEHRGQYLRLAEPRLLTDDLGRVTPLVHGIAESNPTSTGRTLDVHWNDGRRSSWDLVRVRDNVWRLTSG